MAGLRPMKSLRSKLPPANSIVAFEAAARLCNFTAAAGELNVTQPAISRQIKLFEQHLGFSVFHRGSGTLTLTAAGKRLHQSVAMGLDHIASTIADLSKKTHKSHLTIGTTLAFASYWLVPRIASFRSEFPDLELRLLSGEEERDTASDDIDLEVRFGDGNWPQLDVRSLFKPVVLPVCSPAFLQARGPVTSLKDLTSSILLDRERPGSFGITWRNYLTAVGAGSANAQRHIRFNNYDVLIRAAIAGQGVALGWDVLVGDLLQQNQLVCPLNVTMRPDAGYFLVSQKGARRHQHARIFEDWIKRQAQQSDAA